MRVGQLRDGRARIGVQFSAEFSLEGMPQPPDGVGIVGLQSVEPQVADMHIGAACSIAAWRVDRASAT